MNTSCDMRMIELERTVLKLGGQRVGSMDTRLAQYIGQRIILDVHGVVLALVVRQ